MRRVRVLLLLFFLVVFAIFMFSSIRDYLTSDYEAPVITAEEEVVYLSVNDDNDQALLVGMTAADNLDGDVTDSQKRQLRGFRQEQQRGDLCPQACVYGLLCTAVRHFGTASLRLR